MVSNDLNTYQAGRTSTGNSGFSRLSTPERAPSLDTASFGNSLQRFPNAALTQVSSFKASDRHIVKAPAGTGSFIKLAKTGVTLTPANKKAA